MASVEYNLFISGCHLTCQGAWIKSTVIAASNGRENATQLHHVLLLSWFVILPVYTAVCHFDTSNVGCNLKRERFEQIDRNFCTGRGFQAYRANKTKKHFAFNISLI